MLSDRENGPEQSQNTGGGEGYEILSCTNTDKSGGRSRKSRKERKQSKQECKAGARNINPSKFINCNGQINTNAVSTSDPSETFSQINSIKIARLDLLKSESGGHSHMCSLNRDDFRNLQQTVSGSQTIEEVPRNSLPVQMQSNHLLSESAEEMPQAPDPMTQPSQPISEANYGSNVEVRYNIDGNTVDIVTKS